MNQPFETVQKTGKDSFDATVSCSRLRRPHGPTASLGNSGDSSGAENDRSGSGQSQPHTAAIHHEANRTAPNASARCT